MATTVGQNTIATITSPQNGDALDATVVVGNDNTIRTAFNSHDSDSGIHLQSSTLAARPAASWYDPPQGRAVACDGQM